MVAKRPPKPLAGLGGHLPPKAEATAGATDSTAVGFATTWIDDLATVAVDAPPQGRPHLRSLEARTRTRCRLPNGVHCWDFP